MSRPLPSLQDILQVTAQYRGMVVVSVKHEPECPVSSTVRCICACQVYPVTIEEFASHVAAAMGDQLLKRKGAKR